MSAPEERQNDRCRLILILAGHDPSTAGIQADIETCAALGRLALSVVTALTTQNTAIVHKVIPSRPEDVSDQIRTGLDEFKPDACKIGLVPNSAISAVIAGILKNELGDCPTVIDPVTKAGSGGSLALVDMIDALMSDLIPLAEVLTPNAGGVRALTSCDDLEHRVSRLRLTGCESVLVTDAEGGKEVLINQLYIRDEPPERHEMKRLRVFRCRSACSAIECIFRPRSARISQEFSQIVLEPILKLFAYALPPKNGDDKAQRAGHSGSMFKRYSAVSAGFRAQPEGPAAIFVHFGVARR